MHVKRALVFLSLLACAVPGHADRLVFGSFSATENARNWAAKLSIMFAHEMQVQAVQVIEPSKQADGGAPAPALLHRVVSMELDATGITQMQRRAQSAGIQTWRLSTTPGPTPAKPMGPIQQHETSIPPLGAARLQAPNQAVAGRYEWDLGMQSRIFAESGVFGQERLEGSVSVQLEYYRGWANDTRSITFTPFLRLDSADDERTHADLREFYYSHITSGWDLHIGAKRVFWGVTEFHHLIDIVNQTDLVENIDLEDKLGQPMVQWSLVQDWGVLDVYALPGFRERTFPGTQGRLRLPFKILDHASYASGARQKRVDAAIRWSNYMGPFEVGVHHFSGTSREPMLIPELRGASEVVLRPHYPVIDQTGLDAQVFYGDWAFKLEGFSRSGYGVRYAAANLGFERTLVGVFGSKADLGLVTEYMWDERGDDAFNTLYENDIAFGGRFHLNDFSDTKALLGIVFDTERNDYFFSLEASRRLGNSWLISLEGRVFGGGESIGRVEPAVLLQQDEYKSAWLQQEDFLQLELRKYL